MKEPKISQRRIIIRKIKNFLKGKQKKITLKEMIDKINNENYFNDFDENLVNEIYTRLSDYGKVTIQQDSRYKYYVEVLTDNDIIPLIMSEKGLHLKED